MPEVVCQETGAVHFLPDPVAAKAEARSAKIKNVLMKLISTLPADTKAELEQDLKELSET